MKTGATKATQRLYNMSFLLAVLFSTLLLSLPAVSKDKPLVFTHVTVIDVDGGWAKPDMTVLIDKNRIRDLGETAKVRVPKEAQVFNLSGKFVMPGLWDMHVHSRHSAFFLPLCIANGVTGVRDMFSPLEEVRKLRQQIAAGTILGPRVLFSGPTIDGPEPTWKDSIPVTSEDEARQAVASLKNSGSDFVKVYVSVPRSAYFALAREARKRKIPFAGHVPISVSVAEASDAGQKSIEHLDGIYLACSTREAELSKQPMSIARTKLLFETFSEEKAASLFARFARNGTWQTPTLTFIRAVAYLDDRHFTSDPRLKFIPHSLRETWDPKNDPRFRPLTAEDFAALKRFLPTILDLVRRMHRAGVELLAGTDTTNNYSFPGFSLHDELALLVEAGLTPTEALRTATSNPARFFGLLESLGTVSRGKIADLVVLDANPLADIRNTQRISAVVLRGTLLSRGTLDAMLSRAEAGANQR